MYSMPHAAKIAHITAHPRVSLNLDSDGNGTRTVVVACEARVDAVDADPLAMSSIRSSTTIARQYRYG